MGPGVARFVKSADGSEDWMIFDAKIFDTWDRSNSQPEYLQSHNEQWSRYINIQKIGWQTVSCSGASYTIPQMGQPLPPGTTMSLPSGDAGPAAKPAPFRIEAESMISFGAVMGASIQSLATPNTMVLAVPCTACSAGYKAGNLAALAQDQSTTPKQSGLIFRNSPPGSGLTVAYGSAQDASLDLYINGVVEPDPQAARHRLPRHLQDRHLPDRHQYRRRDPPGLRGGQERRLQPRLHRALAAGHLGPGGPGPAGPLAATARRARRTGAHRRSQPTAPFATGLRLWQRSRRPALLGSRVVDARGGETWRHPKRPRPQGLSVGLQPRRPTHPRSSARRRSASRRCDGWWEDPTTFYHGVALPAELTRLDHPAGLVAGLPARQQVRLATVNHGARQRVVGAAPPGLFSAADAVTLGGALAAAADRAAALATLRSVVAGEIRALGSRSVPGHAALVNLDIIVARQQAEWAPWQALSSQSPESLAEAVRLGHTGTPGAPCRADAQELLHQRSLAGRLRA